MKLIVDIADPLYARIQRLINAGTYVSVAAFFSVAAENQATLEEGNDGVDVASPNEYTSIVSGVDAVVDDVKGAEPHDAHETGFQPRSGRWVWGQINNLLAVKYAARLLLTAEINRRSTPTTNSVISKIIFADAPGLTRHLTHLDTASARPRTDAWSKSFPTEDDTSVRRFIAHYFGLKRKDGTVDGALPQLGLVRWSTNDKGVDEVRLTDIGVSFAVLRNPVFDEAGQTKLSKEEQTYYANIIVAASAPEREAFRLIGKILLDRGKVGSRDLWETVATHYEMWNPNTAATLCLGALSRMSDAGLIERVNPGRASAAYKPSAMLTETYQRWTPN